MIAAAEGIGSWSWGTGSGIVEAADTESVEDTEAVWDTESVQDTETAGTAEGTGTAWGTGTAVAVEDTGPAGTAVEMRRSSWLQLGRP